MAPIIHQYRSERNDSPMEYVDNDSSSGYYSSRPSSYTNRPSLRRYETEHELHRRYQQREDYSPNVNYDPRSSSETYASTVPSSEDLPEDVPEYNVPDYTYHSYYAHPVPSTPPEFAELFPSTRRLTIQHDDTTIDGNMNLRVDTKVTAAGGKKKEVTLFHLRMHDLKMREFSLRRYCRDSGREVCHSSLKIAKPSGQRRPSIHRSVTHALALLGGKSESRVPTTSTLKRQDSGYDSLFEEDDMELETKSVHKESSEKIEKNKDVKLEFSNYAHLEVGRRGKKASKHYSFEYWGVNYNWKRSIKKHCDFEEISYHLLNEQSGVVVAHIVPEPLTPVQAREEESKGGWVPPCSLWISDERVLGGLTDVADVIVATGLIALVDDSIRRHFHHKHVKQLVIPTAVKGAFNTDNLEFVGAKRLIDEVFNRRGSTSSHSHRPTPLKQITAEC